MRINSLHPDYEANLPAWSRARDVLAGEDAIKAAAERYLARTSGQSDEEYDAYRQRASFFNATARTADGYLGQIFRRAPYILLPDSNTAVGRAMAAFTGDADLLGTLFSAYARNVTREVIGIGRAGTLIDWEAVESRAYASLFCAEDILNWRVERINGRNVLTRLVLRETADAAKRDPDLTGFPRERLRVLKLVEPGAQVHDNADPCPNTRGNRDLVHAVELWEEHEGEWVCVSTRVPRRLGRPLPLIPFVFHGPRHSAPAPDKQPLADVIAVNLDHYRLNAGYKHGMHFTALPTAWVTGYKPENANTTLTLGSEKIIMLDNVNSRVGFLEFKGDGLMTFERAMDRDERLMAVLGSRLLEPSKKVGETAEAIELRQGGENSVLASMALSISDSLTQVLRWAYWWHSTEQSPEEVTADRASVQLNTDFSVKGMTPQELAAVVGAWQAGALSRDTMIDLFRRGEVLPEGKVGQEPVASNQ